MTRFPRRLILLLLAAPALPALAETADPCGNPMLVSQGYEAHQGTVVEVLDPVTLVVEVPKSRRGYAPFPGCTKKGCRVKVRLVNLDAPADPSVAQAAQQALAATTLSQRVTVSLSSVQDTPGVTNAILKLNEVDFRRVNEAQLEAGYATYRSFGPYAVDWYTECQLKRTEEAAKAAGRGMWAAR